MAATRRREIEQAYSDHKVIVKCVDDLGKLKEVVGRATKHGPTREFAIWSHAALDGPTGEQEVSRPGEVQCFTLDDQLYLDEWAAIDFGWTERSFAVFYGCRTAMGYNRKDGKLVAGLGNDPDEPFSSTAFAYKFMMKHSDLFAAAGQPWYTMPSVYQTGKSWEPSGYSEGEPVYSVAWRGDRNEDGSYYLGGIDDEVRRFVFRDAGFPMRVFYRGLGGGIEHTRRWPNLTVGQVDVIWDEREPQPEYPSQAAALEESANRDAW